MKQEFTTVLQLLYQLKKKYNENHCEHCLVMQQHMKKEYADLKLRLESLIRLTKTNDPILEFEFTRIYQHTTILGMYLMV